MNLWGATMCVRLVTLPLRSLSIDGAAYQSPGCADKNSSQMAGENSGNFVMLESGRCGGGGSHRGWPRTNCGPGLSRCAAAALGLLCWTIAPFGVTDSGKPQAGDGAARTIADVRGWLADHRRVCRWSPDSSRPDTYRHFCLLWEQLLSKPGRYGPRPTHRRGKAAVVPGLEEGLGTGWFPRLTWISSLLVRLGYQGLLDLGIRLDPHHGEYNLLACNPRLGRSSGLRSRREHRCRSGCLPRPDQQERRVRCTGRRDEQADGGSWEDP